MTLAIFAALLLAQASEPSGAPAMPPPVFVPSVPRIEAQAKQQSPDDATPKNQGGESAVNSTKEGWFDRGWAFVGGLALGWIGSLITQWIERRGDGKRLKSICFFRIREAKRKIGAFAHGGQFVEIHGEIVNQLQSAISGRLEWMRGKQQCKAADAWDAFRDFAAHGCRDPTGNDPWSVDARIQNQKAESVKERFLRLLSDLETALK
ncbi:hypothetical protein [Prosthecobacter sp.]|uniref:hypothetical protein n=1 Tax=Prosthecobacter sp. TaxID=1965333 RepID=UPI002ABC5993|nr:hypothetical protein [Prosthecobacter sp.]MDZ4403634.1 hypothetical protein [Prosthecobacter sp.]